MPLDPRRYRPEPRYTGPQVTELAGVEYELGVDLFRALGLPRVDDDVVEFDESDLEVLKTIRAILDQGFTRDDVMTIARTYGYSLSRIAFAQIRLFRKKLVDPLVERGASLDEINEQLDQVVPPLLEVLQAQLVNVHRRHLAVALEQVTASQSSGRTELLAAGFVDLVGFSRLSENIESDDLEGLITRFETLAVESCVSAGAEVVKVIGDAVMFVAPRPEAALEAASAVVQGATGDPDLPEARAGLDHGPVQPLGGDYFGRPINVASRLTGFARPGTVVGSQDLLKALPGERDASHIGRVRLKGVGGVRAFKLFP